MATMGNPPRDQAYRNLVVQDTFVAKRGVFQELFAPGALEAEQAILSHFIVGPAGVDPDDTKYTSIQAAYDAAAATGIPQIVFVRPGTYTENLVLTTSGITIVGLSSTFGVVLNGSVTTNTPAVTPFLPDLLLQNFHVNGDLIQSGAGLTRYESVDVTGNVSQSAGTLILYQSGNSGTVTVTGGFFRNLEGYAGNITVSGTGSVQGLDGQFQDFTSTAATASNIIKGSILGAIAVTNGSLGVSYCNVAGSSMVCTNGTLLLIYCPSIGGGGDNRLVQPIGTGRIVMEYCVGGNNTYPNPGYRFTIAPGDVNALIQLEFCSISGTMDLQDGNFAAGGCDFSLAPPVSGYFLQGGAFAKFGESNIQVADRPIGPSLGYFHLAGNATLEAANSKFISKSTLFGTPVFGTESVTSLMTFRNCVLESQTLGAIFSINVNGLAANGLPVVNLLNCSLKSSSTPGSDWCNTAVDQVATPPGALVGITINTPLEGVPGYGVFPTQVTRVLLQTLV